MKGLQEISSFDSKWRNYALYLCKDKHLSDDIVQDMYIKLSSVEKDLTEFYVLLTIRSIFFNKVNAKKRLISIDDIQIGTEEKKHNLCDYEKKILESFESQKWHQKELLSESIDKSIRQIAKETKLNYGYVFREIKKIKNNILNGS